MMAALLCFVLDLRSIPPPLLLQLKQSFLHLANLCALLEDRVADPLSLCYIAPDGDLRSHEMKIAYCPRVNFSLRDFHHAVDNLPTNCFLMESHDNNPSGDCYMDVTLSGLLCDEVLYSWAGKDIPKKLVFIGSSLIKNTVALRESLTYAGEQSVFIEFVLLDCDDKGSISGKFKDFLDSLSGIGSCRGSRYYPENFVLHGLIQSWFRELWIGIRGNIQIVLVFEDNIINLKSRIYCNLLPSIRQIHDDFIPCQACRCHGQPINRSNGKLTNYYCRVTDNELEVLDLVEHAIIVGEGTVLFLPSKCHSNICPATGPITLTMIKRINISSLDEGLIFGTPYVVTADACSQMGQSSHECGKPEINSQVFKGLSSTLAFLDQCLLCSSTCNMETMKHTDVPCYYILQPSFRGFMLLRNIAASEEILPFSDAFLNDIIVSNEIMSSIRESLAKMPLEDYNPFLHERRFHAKLNGLVRESLQFGAIPDQHIDMNVVRDSIMHPDKSTGAQPSVIQAEEAKIVKDHKEEDFSRVSDGWEQLLIIDEVNENLSSGMRFEVPILMSQSKPIDEQTSRILERLEPPKQKQLQTSPSIPRGGSTFTTKRPLLPVTTNLSMSQPLKPTFQRLKRKQL